MKVNYRAGLGKRFLFLGLAGLIVLPSVVFLFRCFTSSVQNKTGTSLSIKKIVFQIDDVYSEQAQQDIKDFVSGYVEKSNNFWKLDQCELYTNLKDKFKFIKSFTCSIDNQSILQVNFVGLSPVCTINKNQVVAKNFSVLPISLFENFNLEKLPNINVENLDQEIKEDFLSLQLSDFVGKLTDFYWQSFDMNYVKSSEIRLYPKNPDYRCILLSSTKTFFDKDKLDKSLQLYQKIATDKQLQRKLKCSSKKKLILDLRFKSSIVVRSEEDFKEGGV